MKKPLVSGLLVVALLAAITAVTLAQSALSNGKTKVIAIATLMSHPALDAVQDNIKKELARQGSPVKVSLH